jgi:hypothetical protein
MMGKLDDADVYHVSRGGKIINNSYVPIGCPQGILNRFCLQAEMWSDYGAGKGRKREGGEGNLNTTT